MQLDDHARAFIGAGANATLVTLNPDGSPQVSVVWMALQSTPDGDELVSGHLSEKYKKVRNIRRDGRVAVTIVGSGEGEMVAPYLAVIGSARIVEGGAVELLTQLTEALAPGFVGKFPPPESPPGFQTRIRIEKIGGVGPWAS